MTNNYTHHRTVIDVKVRIADIEEMMMESAFLWVDGEDSAGPHPEKAMEILACEKLRLECLLEPTYPSVGPQLDLRT